MTKLRKTLSIFLGITILGAIAAIVYVITVSSPSAFTEFYILGPDGKAMDYPAQLKIGEEGELILGINNLEQETVSYRVEIKIDGVAAGELEPIALEHGEKFEQMVTFTPYEPGEKQKVEFLLFKEGQTDIFESLYIWIDVTR